MALFGKQHFCPSCMEPVRSLNTVCPLCGYNPSDRPASGRYLASNTVINDRYVVGNVLSENPFSVTYVGKDLTDRKKKVIKEYCPFSCASRASGTGAGDPALTVSDDKRSEFKNGLDVFTYNAKRLMAAEEKPLPGIMKVTDVVEAKGTCYMVCDFEEGELLRKLMKNGKFQGKEIFDLVKPVISSLEELHKDNIIHANISPFNIIVSPDRKKATLIGFALGDAAGFDVIPKRGFTPLEEYTSFKGSIGPWTDIFGICSTVYYALTGVIPPEAPDRTVDDEVETPLSLGADISEDREAVLMQGMEVYERDRFKAIRALYNAIYSDEEEVAYFEEEPAPAPEPVPEPVPEPAPKEEPKPAPAPEQEKRSGKKSKADKKHAQKSEPAPAPKPEPTPAPKPEPTPAPKAEPAPAPKPEPVPAPKAEPAPAPKAEPAPAPVSAEAPRSEEYSQVIVHRKNKDFTEINGVKYSLKLDTLDLSGTNLTDTDAKELERFTNMEYLTLNDNSLGTLEFVSQMKKLIILSASGNFITDISMLVNLPELREINLAGNKELEDISVFEYIRRIRKLDLSNTAVSDIKPLFYLDQLHSLDLRGTKVTARQIKKLYAEMPSCVIKYDYKK